MKKTKNIPNTWEWVTIKDIAITSSGGTPDRNNSSYFKGDIPWVKSGELNYNTIVQTDEYITQEALESSSAKVFTKGSLLIALYGNTVGRMAFLGIDAATNQAIASIKPFIINPKYLYYYLINSKEELLNKREGSAQPNISQKVLNDFSFPLAPIEEQNRIVERIEELFSELDKITAELNEAKTKANLLLRALLNNSFSNVNTYFDIRKLEDLCENITDGSHFSPETTLDGFPYITVKDVKNDRIDFENCKKISEESFLKLKMSGCSPKFNDILFSKDGTVGKVVINDYKSDFVVLSSLAILTPNQNKILPQYLFYYLKSDLFLNQALNSKRGVAIKRIVLRDLKDLIIKIPTNLNTQLDIVTKIEEGFSNINTLIEEIASKIQSNDNLIKKILKDAFQGNLSSRLNTDTSVKILLEEINTEKTEYLVQQHEINKSRPKFKKVESESLVHIIKKNFMSKSFSFHELVDKAITTNSEFEKEFDLLLSENILSKMYDEKSKSIKFRLK